MALSVDIEKKLGEFHLKVKFEVKNEVLSILGASGCGKSMTLKCIAGIEKPDRGRIVLNGMTLFDSEKKINLPPQKRNVGYLFQQYALFPNMTVEQNIACGVRDKKKKASMVEEYVRIMNLEGLERKKPHQLSGGQQQRVALARILVNEPEVLLLDEPFSALDSFLKFQLEQEVQDIIRHFQKTVVLVSHDCDEVFRLSDSAAIMQDGRIEKTGEKREVFRNPGTKSGAELTGCENIFRADMVDSGHIYVEDLDVTLRVPEFSTDVKYAGIRTHDVKVSHGTCENTIECIVTGEIENPFSYTIMLRPVGEHTKGQIGMQIQKSSWETLRDEHLTIILPPDAILILEE